MRAMRFLGDVSSSPSRASTSRSYHREPSDGCTYCGAIENALGANSADVSCRESGCSQGAIEAAAEWGTLCVDGLRASGVKLCGVVGNDVCLTRFGMFAVGGGAAFVRPVFGVPASACFGLCAVFALGEGVPPYFLSSSWVELYFVAVFSFSMVVVLCFSRSSDCFCNFDIL